MKCQCIVILVIITFLSVGHAGVTARAEGKVESNRTLAGLRSIAVEVPDLDDTYRKALTADGISGSSLELSVEQQLEVAGIQVIPISQFKESDQYGLIRITLEILAPEALAKLGRIRFGDETETARETSRHVYQIMTQVRQVISLKRDSAITAVVPTWQKTSLGFSRLSQIRQVISRHIEAFLSDYRRMNQP